MLMVNVYKGYDFPCHEEEVKDCSRSGCVGVGGAIFRPAI